MAAKLRAELVPLVNSVLDKVAMHILYSRLYITNEQKKEMPLTSKDEDLNSLSNVRFRQHFDTWNTQRTSALIINIYFQPNKGSRVLLEKWRLQVVRNEGSHGRLMAREQYFACFRTLLRTCSCFLRTLPTYRFLFNAQLENFGTSAHRVEYNSEFFENDPAFDQCPVKQYEFSDIDVSFGHTSVRVCYRADCSSLMPLKVPKSVDIIEDYKPSERSVKSVSSPVGIAQTNSQNATGTKNTRIIPAEPTKSIDIPGASNSYPDTSFSPSPSPSPSSRFLLSRSPFQSSLHGSSQVKQVLGDLFLGNNLIQSSCTDTTNTATGSSSALCSSLNSKNVNSRPILSSASVPKLESHSSKHLSLSVSPFKESGSFSSSQVKKSQPCLSIESVNLSIENSFLFQEESSSISSGLFDQSYSGIFGDGFDSSEEDIDDLISSCVIAATKSQEEADRLSTSSLTDSYFGSSSLPDIIADLEHFDSILG